MAVTTTVFITRMPSHIKGLYTWVGHGGDVGDVTGGSAEIKFRFQASVNPSPSLWYYLTYISFQMTVVTAQAAHLKFDLEDWPNINGGFAGDTFIGIPAPAMDADSFGATAPINMILPKPYYMGQPASEQDSDVAIITTNTDTMVTRGSLYGFATQYPLDPRQFYS